MSDLGRTAASEPLVAALVECRREYGVDFQCLLDGREPAFKCHLLPRSIQRLLFAIGAALEAPEPVCFHHQDRFSVWNTECGKTMTWVWGTPEENGAKFCWYCGARLIGIPWTEQEEEVTP